MSCVYQSLVGSWRMFFTTVWCGFGVSSEGSYGSESLAWFATMAITFRKSWKTEVSGGFLKVSRHRQEDVIIIHQQNRCDGLSWGIQQWQQRTKQGRVLIFIFCSHHSRVRRHTAKNVAGVQLKKVPGGARKVVAASKEMSVKSNNETGAATSLEWQLHLCRNKISEVILPLLEWEGWEQQRDSAFYTVRCRRNR